MHWREMSREFPYNIGRKMTVISQPLDQDERYLLKKLVYTTLADEYE
jgi:hypothetical protein